MTTLQDRLRHLSEFCVDDDRKRAERYRGICVGARAKEGVEGVMWGCGGREGKWGVMGDEGRNE